MLDQRKEHEVDNTSTISLQIKNLFGIQILCVTEPAL